jgi:putative redox protein
MTDQAPRAAALARDSGPAPLSVEVAIGALTFAGDEPVEAGGGGMGPGPYDLLCAALAECSAMTVRLYAARKAWPLEHISVAVDHAREPGATPPDIFHRRLMLEGPLDGAQRERLAQIAQGCPVHRTLSAGARIATETLDQTS